MKHASANPIAWNKITCARESVNAVHIADVVSVDRFGLNAEVTELTAYFKQYP